MLHQDYKEVIREKYITADLQDNFTAYLEQLNAEMGQTSSWSPFGHACMAISEELQSVEAGSAQEHFYVSRMSELITHLAEVNKAEAIDLASNRLVKASATDYEREQMFEIYSTLIDEKINTQIQTSPNVIKNQLNGIIVQLSAQDSAHDNTYFISQIQQKIEHINEYAPVAEPLFSDEVEQAANRAWDQYRQEDHSGAPAGHGKHLAIKHLLEDGNKDAAIYLYGQYVYEESFFNETEGAAYLEVATELYKEKFTDVINKARENYTAGNYLEAAEYAQQAHTLIAGRHLNPAWSYNMIKEACFDDDSPGGGILTENEEVYALLETFGNICQYQAGSVDRALDAQKKGNWSEAANYVWSQPYRDDYLYNTYGTLDTEEATYSTYTEKAAQRYAEENGITLGKVHNRLNDIKLYAELNTVLTRVETSMDNSENMHAEVQAVQQAIKAKEGYSLDVMNRYEQMDGTIMANMALLNTVLERYGIESFDAIPPHIISALDGDQPGRFNNAMIKGQIYADIKSAENSGKKSFMESGQTYTAKSVGENSFVTSNLDRLATFVQSLGAETLFDAARIFKPCGVSIDRYTWGRPSIHEFNFSDSAMGKVFASYASNIQHNSPTHTVDPILRNPNAPKSAEEVLSDYMSSVARGACPSTLMGRADCAGYYIGRGIDKVKSALHI